MQFVISCGVLVPPEQKITPEFVQQRFAEAVDSPVSSDVARTCFPDGDAGPVTTAADPGPIRIATRASRLALWQPSMWRRCCEMCRLVTLSWWRFRRPATGTARNLWLRWAGSGSLPAKCNGPCLMVARTLRYNSLKDLPTDLVAGLTLAGVPERAPRFDVLVQPDGVGIESVDDLPQGARIGTGSLRRRAQLLNHRSDLQMEEIRGNVETRLRKLDEGEYDAVVLAEAGLQRLGLAGRISLRLEPPLMLPAVGQAAIGIECRADDESVVDLLKRISDAETQSETTAERACLAELRAGCHAHGGGLGAG